MAQQTIAMQTYARRSFNYLTRMVDVSRVDALYRYVRGESIRFVFLPEQIGRHGDIVLCETCVLMGNHHKIRY
ncbi:MAG: hypothetical protein HY328_05465 [Chloroflexi bacterium]|nr:hypothetical protein [Chloroflexota bacterium]